MAILKAEDVARYFLAKQEVSRAGEAISNLKIQKLCYYAQGFALVRLGQPLFFEDVIHWNHGPFVPQLWKIYNKYGSSPIPLEGSFRADTYPPEIRAVLDEVFTRYEKFSASELRNKTHSESPWLETPDGAAITYPRMRKFFDQLVENLTSIDQPRRPALEGVALATAMKNDRHFSELTEKGLADLEAGRYYSPKDLQ